jgi:hypothetical protein
MSRVANCRAAVIGLALLCAGAAGCGASKQRMATEQLLLSDAVDRAVSRIDFSSLAGRRVYFDTQYVQNVAGLGFVNGPYVVSSLRQQMMAAGCLLQDKAPEADLIVEARVGTLGADAHEVTYGIPSTANNAVANAASFMPNVPRMPALPDFAVARRSDMRGAAKISVFAYHRETRTPVWQSGIALATTTARDAWVFGAGPILHGTVYERAKFPPRFSTEAAAPSDPLPAHLVSYFDEVRFPNASDLRDLNKKRLPPRNERPLDPIASGPQLLPFSQQVLSTPMPSWAEPPVRPASGPAPQTLLFPNPPTGPAAGPMPNPPLLAPPNRPVGYDQLRPLPEVYDGARPEFPH